MKGLIVQYLSHRPHRRVAACVIACLFALLSSRLAVADALADEIHSLLTSDRIGRMRVGAQIVVLQEQPWILAQINEDEPLKPASNQKILTTAAALTLLPKDFAFRTVLGLRGDDLVVIGAGDPAFGDPRLARKADRAITAVFHEWADKLRANGVTHISGDLLFDDSIFEQAFINPSWIEQFKGQMQQWYVAPVGGLNFNGNCVDVLVRPGESRGSPAEVTLIPNTPYTRLENTCKTAAKGQPKIHRDNDDPLTIKVSGTVSRPGDPENPQSLTVRDPGLFFATTLRTVLATNGIAVEGKLRRERVRADDNSIPADLRVVAVHEQTLPDVFLRSNRDSQNMFAEALFKAVGAYAGVPTDRPRVGSYETGREVVGEFLEYLRLDVSRCVLDDGSGLSHSNRTTAAVLAGVLVYMDRHPRRAEWISDLAEPGKPGTLRKRMKDLKGQVFGKTGHISGVSTLSGYVHGPDDRRYAFAILCNDSHRGKISAHSLQDTICRKLAAYSGPLTTAGE